MPNGTGRQSIRMANSLSRCGGRDDVQRCSACHIDLTAGWAALPRTATDPTQRPPDWTRRPAGGPSAASDAARRYVRTDSRQRSNQTGAPHRHPPLVLCEPRRCPPRRPTAREIRRRLQPIDTRGLSQKSARRPSRFQDGCARLFWCPFPPAPVPAGFIWFRSVQHGSDGSPGGPRGFHPLQDARRAPVGPGRALPTRECNQGA